MASSPPKRIGIFAAPIRGSTACCGRADSHPNRNKFNWSDGYAGDGPRRFQASIDRAECAASLHGQHGRLAAFVSDAGDVAVEFASQGLSGDRVDRLGQMFLL